MHFKRCYTICICSFIRGELKPFRNFKGFSIIVPKILDAIYHIMKVKNFFIPLSITFLNPKILGFLFPSKNSLACGVKCEKLKLHKIVGSLLDKL